MGLFTPAWNKDGQKAMEAAASSDIKTLWRMVNECRFQKPQFAALGRLCELADDPQAVIKLKDIAEHSQSHIIRCMAAEGTRDEAFAAKIISETITYACSDPLTDEFPPQTGWLKFVSPYLQAGACQCCASNSWRTAFADALTEPEAIKYLFKHIGSSKDIDDETLNKLLSRYEGSHNDYIDIAEHAYHRDVLKDAYSHFNEGDEKLLLKMADARPGAPRIYGRAVPREKLAVDRLVELFPEKYLEWNADRAPKHVQQNAIDKGMLSQKALTDICLSDELKSLNAPAFKALEQITDPKLLRTILFRKTLRASQMTGDQEKVCHDWYDKLFERLASLGKQDALADFILSSNKDKYINADPLALKHMTDEKQLLKVASGSGSLAMKAAELLPDTSLKALAKSANMHDIATYAQKRALIADIQGAGDKKLLTIISNAKLISDYDIAAMAALKIRERRNKQAAAEFLSNENSSLIRLCS
ncbi:MAG: hypothetical protein IJL97_01680, partial [Lachnospiraceae bacterium]|nr:hypothetical protein [Lachnospiraceae bacterium]